MPGVRPISFEFAVHTQPPERRALFWLTLSCLGALSLARRACGVQTGSWAGWSRQVSQPCPSCAWIAKEHILANQLSVWPAYTLIFESFLGHVRLDPRIVPDPRASASKHVIMSMRIRAMIHGSSLLGQPRAHRPGQVLACGKEGPHTRYLGRF
eukprot:3936053-Rhodomonas_salina.4